MEGFCFAGVETPPAAKSSTRRGFLLGIACIPIAVMAGVAGAYWWIVVRKRKSEETANYIAMTDNDTLLDRLEEP